MNLGSVAEAALAAGATKVIIANAMESEKILKFSFFITRISFFVRLDTTGGELVFRPLSEIRSIRWCCVPDDADVCALRQCDTGFKASDTKRRG